MAGSASVQGISKTMRERREAGSGALMVVQDDGHQHRIGLTPLDYVIVTLSVYCMFFRRVVVHFRNRRHFHDLRLYKEDPRWPGWQVIVGIETHAQIKSRRKLFSGAYQKE